MSGINSDRGIVVDTSEFFLKYSDGDLPSLFAKILAALIDSPTVSMCTKYFNKIPQVVGAVPIHFEESDALLPEGN